MEVQLFRIDDRLIHGQVVLSWAKYLKSERIILCDNEVAENDWEKELYISCVPQSLQCMVSGSKTTSEYLLTDLKNLNKTIVLVKSPTVLREITDYGFIPAKVNMGGIHYAANRKKYLSYLFLSDSEVEDIKILTAKGISIYCQEVPTSKKYNILDIINGK
jgi:mannose/fructose/N-acetylgalactosamine-specific phosphotransferase system component IIB